MDRKRLLLIKHGFSETCDHHVSGVVSYGDVFSCTCLLEDFKGYEVTWISSPLCYDLLAENHLIDRLVLADSPSDLSDGEVGGEYEIVVNLEKQRDWCEFAAGVAGEQRYGFRDWTGSCEEGFYPESAAALARGLARYDFRPLQETLYATVGRQWNGQRYVLGYQPRVATIYDVGLNYNVGSKWPTKAWPGHLWEELHYELSKDYAVCWQQSLNSVRHYIDWLASCRLIVTCDSLGLHLGLGLKKKVVGLFGPTAAEQVYMYGCGVKITPVCERSCLPCYQSQCAFDDDTCMTYIPVDMVREAVDMLLRGMGRVSEVSGARELTGSVTG